MKSVNETKWPKWSETKKIGHWEHIFEKIDINPNTYKILNGLEEYFDAKIAKKNDYYREQENQSRMPRWIWTDDETGGYFLLYDEHDDTTQEPDIFYKLFMSKEKI